MTSTSLVGRLSLLSALALGGSVARQGALPAPSLNLPNGVAPTNHVDATPRAAVLSDSSDRIPRVHLALSRTDSYVDPKFSVSGDAYVMVVAVDLDRKVQVLFPATPRDGGFVKQGTSQTLLRFYAGFGKAARSDDADARAQARGGRILAIASNHPLQYDRFMSSDIDWDANKLRTVVSHITAGGAANSLGHSLMAKDQEFTAEFQSLNFAPVQGNHE
jgi:hypothetical protein